MSVFCTDNHFHVGKAHLTNGNPCQDYALSETSDNAALALVADGCSTGGNTDVGARILALSTRSAVREHWTIHKDPLEAMAPEKIELRQQILAAGARETLGLSPEDMLATCVYAYLSPKGGFVRVLGDGVIAWKDRNECVEILRYEWINNIPFYPTYLQNEETRRSFIEAHGGDLNAPAVQENRWTYQSEGEFLHLGTTELSLSMGMQGVTLSFCEKQVQDKLAFLAVFSDGVTQIDGVDWKDATQKLLAFKNTTGVFAKRRMIRFIKDTQKTGRGPIDDIAYAVIRIEPTSTKEN